MAGYISEISYAGGSSADFVEIVVPAGTNVSGWKIHLYDNGYVYDGFSIGTLQTTVGGYDVYLLNTSTDGGFYGVSSSDEVALVDGSGTALQYISFGETRTAADGPANGMTSADIGTATGSNSLQSDDGGATYYTQTSQNPGTIPACYAPGTLVDTPGGPCPVERLRPGDRIDTLDHGPQTLRWIYAGAQSLYGAGRAQRPVLIRAGALGAGCPARDLIVSPQHRILVGEAGQLAGAFGAPAFAPAKALTGLPGIRQMMGRRDMTWHQLALERHHVIRADGCLSESLLLGPMVLAGLDHAARRAVRDRFGPSARAGAALNGPPARTCLTVREVRAALSGPGGCGGPVTAGQGAGAVAI